MRAIEKRLKALETSKGAKWKPIKFIARENGIYTHDKKTYNSLEDLKADNAELKKFNIMIFEFIDPKDYKNGKPIKKP